MAIPKIFIVKGVKDYPILFTLDDDGKLQQLTEKQLGRRIHHFSELTIKAKEKHLEHWLDKKAKVVLDLEINTYLANAPWKVDRHEPTNADRERGAQALLTVTKLFGSPVAGYRLLADTLCGMHMTALREAVLDYRRQGIFSPRLREHTTLTIKTKYGKLKQPFPYCDTIVLVSGAESGQMRELVPWAKDAAILLLNNSGAGLDPTVLSASDISSYDPQVLQMIEAESSRIASLLAVLVGILGRRGRLGCSDCPGGPQIVRSARQPVHFG